MTPSIIGVPMEALVLALVGKVLVFIIVIAVLAVMGVSALVKKVL